MRLKSFSRITAIATTVALLGAPAMVSAQSAPSQSAPNSLPRGLVEISGTLQTFGPYFTLNGVEVDAGARWWRVNTQAAADLDGNGTRQSWDEELRGLVGKNVRLVAEADDDDYDVIEINGVALRSPSGPPPWAGGPWRGESRGEWRGERNGEYWEEDDWDEEWEEVRDARGARGDLREGRGPRDIVLDRQQTNCGNALVTAKLERDSREHEVDIEVYSNDRGERWRMTIKDVNGNVLRTASRTTNDDAEFDVTRTISGSINRVSVEVRGPAGQRCSLQLRA